MKLETGPGNVHLGRRGLIRFSARNTTSWLYVRFA
jgi:hypothetical protein